MGEGDLDPPESACAGTVFPARGPNLPAPRHSTAIAIVTAIETTTFFLIFFFN